MQKLIKYKDIITVATRCVILDQLIKIIISILFVISESKTIIPNFFNITFEINYGAAWSILYGGRYLLIAIAIAIMYLIYRYFIKGQELSKKDNIIYGLLYGGIIGNLIDRIVRGYVIDYLDFNIFGYNYPIFNLADILIVISVFIIVIKLVRGDKDEYHN